MGLIDMEDVYRVTAVGTKVRNHGKGGSRGAEGRAGSGTRKVRTCALTALPLFVHARLSVWQMGINNMFEVVTTNRTYHLIADSDREMRQWIDILTYGTRPVTRAPRPHPCFAEARSSGFGFVRVQRGCRPFPPGPGQHSHLSERPRHRGLADQGRRRPQELAHAVVRPPVRGRLACERARARAAPLLLLLLLLQLRTNVCTRRARNVALAAQR